MHFAMSGVDEPLAVAGNLAVGGGVPDGESGINERIGGSCPRSADPIGGVGCSSTTALPTEFRPQDDCGQCDDWQQQDPCHRRATNEHGCDVRERTS